MVIIASQMAISSFRGILHINNCNQKSSYNFVYKSWVDEWVPKPFCPFHLISFYRYNCDCMEKRISTSRMPYYYENFLLLVVVKYGGRVLWSAIYGAVENHPH